MTGREFRQLVKLKARFALTSGVATAIYYGLYLALVYSGMAPVPANVSAYSVAVVVNFLLQKRFIFDLRRRTRTAFLLSILVSLGGIGLSTALIWWLGHYAFFNRYEPLKVLTVSGLLFLYNFYGKRLSFERRLVEKLPNPATEQPPNP